MYSNEYHNIYSMLIYSIKLCNAISNNVYNFSRYSVIIIQFLKYWGCYVATYVAPYLVIP